MKRIVIAGAMVGMATFAWADGVEVKDAWARATAPGQESAMVQMVFTSKKDAKLVGVTCKDAATAELHSMVHESGMMKMRRVDAIDLPAGKAVDLGEAGYHLMLMGLKQPLVEGKKTKCELMVRGADGKVKKVEVEAEVKALTDAGEYSHGHMHHH